MMNLKICNNLFYNELLEPQQVLRNEYNFFSFIMSLNEEILKQNNIIHKQIVALARDARWSKNVRRDIELRKLYISEC